MMILALDSCGAGCAAGVWSAGRWLARIQQPMDRGQDAALLPLITKVMSEAGTDYPALDRIAVPRGPGSFTGVRVCLAAAQGLGLAAGKPVIGLDRFSLYRALHADKARLLVVLDSRRAELFCQYSEGLQTPHEICLMTQAQITAFLEANPDTCVAGDIATPNDDVLAACARLATSADVTDTAFTPRPLYCRAPDVTMAAS